MAKLIVEIEVKDDMADYVKKTIEGAIRSCNDPTHRGFGWSKPIKEFSIREQEAEID